MTMRWMCYITTIKSANINGNNGGLVGGIFLCSVYVCEIGYISIVATMCNFHEASKFTVVAANGSCF